MKSKIVDKTIQLLNKRVLENKILRAFVLFGIATIFYGVSYAYWTGTVDGNIASVEDELSTSKLRMNFDKTKDIELDDSAKKVTKTFTITNDETYAVNYNILWEYFTNTYENDDVVFDLVGNNQYMYNNPIHNTGEEISILNNIRIAPQETHTYTLTIRNTNVNKEHAGKVAKGRLAVFTNPEVVGYGLANQLIRYNTPTTATTNPGTATATTDEGLISGEEDNDGETYYFRGNVTDNYVSFAGKTWRVIRINGDGSVRMILDGKTAIKSAWNSTADTTYNNAYQTDSHDRMVSWFTYSNTLLKTGLDSWYDSNIGNNLNYKRHIAKSEYCNDLTHTGTSKGITIGAGNRITSPTFKCPSSYTYNLNIATITADEVLFAGGKYGATNSSYYLNVGDWYWTMSPYSWDSSARVNATWISSGSVGQLFGADGVIKDSGLVRPVINLKGDTLVTVNNTNPGTSSNPYVVSTSNSEVGEGGSLKFSNISATGVKIKWESAPNATYYKIERKTGIGSYITISSNLTDNEYNDSGLTANSTYKYRVQACNSSGCNINKKSGTITTSISVGAVNAFSTTYLTGVTVSLSWSAASNATYYRLERKSKDENYYLVNKNIESITYTDTITNDLTDYTYRVRGCVKNKDNLEYCGTAKTLNVKTRLYLGSAGIPTFTNLTDKSVTINYAAGENATYYKIARMGDEDEQYTTVTSSNSSLSYNDSGLTSNYSYIYRVIACATDSAGEICGEPVYSEVTTAPAIGQTTISVTGRTTTTLSIAWSEATNAQYYKVEYDPGATGTYTMLNSNTTTRTYSSSNLTNNTEYVYRITPCALSSTNTEYCATPTVRNMHTIPIIGSTTLNLSAVEDDSLTASWNAAENAQYYKLQKSLDNSNFTMINNHITTTTYNPTGLTPETLYYFKLIPCAMSDGEEICNTTISVKSTTTGPPLGPIATLSFSNIQSNKVTLNWTSATNATKYKIDRRVQGTESYTTVTSNVTDLTYTNSLLSQRTVYEYQVSPCLTYNYHTYCGDPTSGTVQTPGTYNLSNNIPSSVTVNDVMEYEPGNTDTGSYVAVTLQPGVYRLEAWGAHGNGYTLAGNNGGKAGYAGGTYTIYSDTTVYLYAGGTTSYDPSLGSGASNGGYNGGGSGNTGDSRFSSNPGGGASHIATAVGLLKDLESNKSAVLLVAGGGGGAGKGLKGLGSFLYLPGGDGGGTSGNDGNGTDGANTDTTIMGHGGTQSSGGAASSGYSQPTAGSFGQGGSAYNGTTYSSLTANNTCFPGSGGGGWYGGGGGYAEYIGTSLVKPKEKAGSGGGGSGYVNPILTDTSLISGSQTMTDYDGDESTGHIGRGALRMTCLARY